MRTVLVALSAALALAPVAASAQYYEGGYGPRRHHDHGEFYRHDDVVRSHHSPGYEGWRYHRERPPHYHHQSDD